MAPLLPVNALAFPVQRAIFSGMCALCNFLDKYYCFLSVSAAISHLRKEKNIYIQELYIQYINSRIFKNLFRLCILHAYYCSLNSLEKPGGLHGKKHLLVVTSGKHKANLTFVLKLTASLG